jgi:hypothetical protein
VAPAEIEGILISHPFVNEGVVCAKWDENQGTEVPMAYVTLTKAGQSHASGVEAVLGVIREFIDGKVSPYKRLRGGVEILDEIPKTAFLLDWRGRGNQSFDTALEGKLGINSQLNDDLQKALKFQIMNNLCV